MTCRWLILVPTEMERERLLLTSEVPSATVELCGFGAIVAAARTTRLIDQHQPDNVLLVGIAGSLNDRAAIGSAYVFEKVACYGIGVGSGTEFRSAGDMGWPQWDGDGQRVDDVIELRVPETISFTIPFLLSACSSSGSEQEANIRMNRFAAAAEDMEGFAVAAACHLSGITPTIVRGISNRAGDRQHADWKIDGALSAASHLVRQIIRD